MLGLSEPVRTCLFDLNGALKQTAKVHAVAWKRMFDHDLCERAEGDRTDFVPFGAVEDYDACADGRPCEDSVRTLLASRDNAIPDGTVCELPPNLETVHGPGACKNDLMIHVLREQGVEAYDGSVACLRAVPNTGLHDVVVSSGVTARIETRFEQCVDVSTLAEQKQKLRVKPAPGSYLAGARLLDAVPGSPAIFEDAAYPGVEAAGHGGVFVIGVDRTGHVEALSQRGADIMISDLRVLLACP
ncbi:hypothetical protein [Streptomyces vinaceus]|uniref:hypothetical protein n=1 Tax=Streptomyces vinaceus TaxID=1960 RepID=UPI0037F413E6